MEKKGEGKNREVWIHPKLAISFAMWLSREFEMMVSEWVEQWLFASQKPATQEPINLHPYQRVWYERLRLFEEKTELPKGRWCVFEEIGKLMRKLESKNVILHDRATIEISVGKTWCYWLRENGYETDFEQYLHHYPDKRGEQLANIYPYKLLGEFHQWLQETYIPEKLPEYVRKLVTSEECKLISQAIGYEIKPVLKKLKANV